MNEQLGLAREVVVDDVVEQGDVDAARRQVGDQQDVDLAVLELGDADLTRRLVARAVDVATGDAGLLQQLVHTTYNTISVRRSEM